MVFLGIRVAVGLVGLPTVSDGNAATVVNDRPAGFTCGATLASGRSQGWVASRATRTTGIQRVLMLRVRFEDDPAEPVAREEAEASLAEADAWFRRISYGAFGFTATVSSVVSLGTERGAYAGADAFDRLLNDARDAGIRAGFDYRDYDLEIVRHSGISNLAGGNARLGERGAQIQIPGAWVILHELGHNLGLSHANFWDTSAPSFFLGSPPLPSNYESIPDIRSIPTHPESLFGHDTVIGPGNVIEYGDPWDIMGAGTVDFSAAYKALLGWMTPNDRVDVPSGQSRHRVYGVEAVSPQGVTLPRMLRIPGPAAGPAGGRDYGVELPSVAAPASPASGVLVRWLESVPGRGSSLLLDGTPRSVALNADAYLPVGRTFVDSGSRVSVTPLAAGIEDGLRWVDVAITRGGAHSNQAPALSLVLDRSDAMPGEEVRLTAEASVADGGALSFFWEFGDGTVAGGESMRSVVHAWSEVGDYTVRLEVSDLKGGVAYAHGTVRVGNPGTRRVRGMVRDDRGEPVSGVRVYTERGGGDRPSAPYGFVLTDAQGRYTLTGLPPGLHTVCAFHPDHVIERRAAIALEAGDREDLDWEAVRLPRISVSASAPAVREDIGFVTLFTFHRSGSVAEPLTVQYRLGGSSSGGSDYVRPLLDRVVFPVGAATATLGFPILNDDAPEPSETLTVAVVESARFDRTGSQGERFAVYYPGWELSDIGGTTWWVQTRPSYVADEEGTAELVIEDDDGFHELTLSAQLRKDGAYELSVGGPVGVRVVVESSVDLVKWAPIRTNVLVGTPSISMVLPHAFEREFYRAVRQ